MRSTPFFLLLLLFTAFRSSAQLSSPDQYLGYALGSRFTPHHRIAAYFGAVAAGAPDRVKLQNYGTTNEGRPLLAAFISTPENLARLEEIRKNNLGLARMGGTGAAGGAPVIVWLSYNVHGNEPSSSEAAMKTLYSLLDPANRAAAGWLKNTIVVIDPCLNPDGRDRYVNWYNSVRGQEPAAQLSAREHNEPWPGGRVNHYYFDLNRDWAWQTQVESKARVQLYRSWMPQIHVDFHEQGINNPYYFAPAAEPYHDAITPWQRRFQETIGKNHAKYFDRNGWLYFTREIFDLFYPSYGDTYPLFNGAIGMTYEQAGGPQGGLAALMATGDTLTLTDRIAHHYTTGMSTIEAASTHAAELLKNFQDYYTNAVNGTASEYKTFIVRYRPEDAERFRKLEDLLESNGIRFGKGKGSGRGLSYASGKEEAFNIAGEDIVVSVNQPCGALARVLFEPNPHLSDSVTYDITAWALPYVYGLSAYASRTVFPVENVRATVADKSGYSGNEYGYVLRWNGTAAASLTARMLAKGAKLRCSQRSFTANGVEYGRGSIILLRSVQPAGLWSEVLDMANESGVQLQAIKSGLADRGADLGSSSIHPLSAPKVALMAGDGTSSNAVGEVWYYFEKELNYPVTLINTIDFARTDWSAYNVLVLANGSYRFLNEKSNVEALRSWVSRGGKVIALEGGVAAISGLDWGLKARKPDEGGDTNKVNYSLLRRYEDREREEIAGYTPGAIYRVELDNSHPLAYGYGSTYYTLRQDDRAYEFLSDGWNVGVIKRDKPVAGFVGNKLAPRLQDALVIGVQDIGSGEVVYFADDILFRDFWENGKLLFANAVFQVGQ